MAAAAGGGSGQQAVSYVSPVVAAGESCLCRKSISLKATSVCLLSGNRCLSDSIAYCLTEPNHCRRRRHRGASIASPQSESNLLSLHFMNT